MVNINLLKAKSTLRLSRFYQLKCPLTLNLQGLSFVAVGKFEKSVSLKVQRNMDLTIPQVFLKRI